MKHYRKMVKEGCPALSAALLGSSQGSRMRTLAKNQHSAQHTLLATAELEG